jgi:hypothetical protein
MLNRCPALRQGPFAHLYLRQEQRASTIVSAVLFAFPDASAGARHLNPEPVFRRNSVVVHVVHLVSRHRLALAAGRPTVALII